jgi:hypothetical protein
MDKLTRQDQEININQMLASWELEGFEPDADYLALLNQYVCGEISTEEALAQITPRYPVADEPSSLAA